MFGEVLQATTPRRITGVTRTQSSLGLGNNKVLRCRIGIKFGLGNAKAVAKKAAVRLLLGTNACSHLRPENHRAIIAEVDNLASWVVAEKVAITGWLPSPCLLDVMDDGAYRYLRILMPVVWTTMLFPVGVVAIGGGTTITHYSPCKN